MDTLYPNGDRESPVLRDYHETSSRTYLGHKAGDFGASSQTDLAYDDEKTSLSHMGRRSFSDNRTSKSGESDSPYSMVRAVVPPRDDRQAPSLTFRSILLGVFFSSALAFVNQLLWFKATPIAIGGFAVQILSFPCGYLLAKILPPTEFTTFGYKWSLNPGPFSIKEHAVISICATTAATSAYAIDIIVIENVWYGKNFGYGPAFLLTASSLMLGYSYAGLVREILVYPAAMIWPSSLVSVTLLRTFHEIEPSVTHGISRVRFFWIVFGCSFAWYFVPGFIMPLLSFIPVLCLIAPHNIYANQLGDAYHGLGLLNFTFDWSVMSSTLYNSPIAIPWFMACNIFAGFVIMMWIAVPAGYYSNVWDSGNLPIYSSNVFQANGSRYSVAQVMNSEGFLDEAKYAAYGPIRLSFQLAFAYAMMFMSIVALVVYTLLHHGKDIYDRLRSVNFTNDDVHAKLMRKYDEVPKWWYLGTFVVMFAMAVGVCEGYKMLPWYWLVLAFVLSLIFIVPVGIVQALSNQQPGLNLITELIIGYGRPGDPLGNSVFKVFGYISMRQALSLLADQKMGHYMKIPPRHVFISQMIGTVVCAFVQPGVSIWMLTSVKNICTPAGAPWTCPQAGAFFSASIIWGLVGPGRLFGAESNYSVLLYMFIVGAVLPIPVWYMQRRYPLSLWKYIHIPVLISSTALMPPAPTTTVTSWFFVCFVVNFVAYRHRYTWWQKYAFALSAALDSSVGLASVFIYLVFYLTSTEMPSYWGTKTNHCPLAANSGYKNYKNFS